MSLTDPDTLAEPATRRALRVDAQRNRERLIAAAREAFAQHGAATSLEAIARLAHVGIGTLYRNFATRQDLLEAVYLEELGALCRSAEDLAALPPWDAVDGWFRRFVGYVATKRALAEELFAYVDRDAPFFSSCRSAIYAAGEPLFIRAQRAGEVRPDVEFEDALQMVMGIAKASGTDPERTMRIVELALDGLRPRA